MRPQLLPPTRRYRWTVTALGGSSAFRDDDGSANPAVAAALAAFAAGLGSEHAALTALAGSRLLVPVVAAASRDERVTEMSLPTLIGKDGRSAVPAFTCLDSLGRWQAGARPVPTEPGRLWRAAVADSCAVVVDIAGPVPLAVDGARLAALADGLPVPLPHQDPDVQAAVQAAAAAMPAVTGISLAPGENGTDLAIEVTLAAGCGRAAGEEAIRALGTGLMAELSGRLRRGITVAATAVAGDRRP
jgi:hypothetical protein